MPEQKEVFDVVEEAGQDAGDVSGVEQESGGVPEEVSALEEMQAESEALAEQANEIVEKAELEAAEPEAPEAVVEEEEVVAEAEATEEEIQQGLSALKDALMPQVDDEPTLEEISEIHALQAKHGMAGSRNAVKIDKNRDEVKGQRPGMRIGQPTRHYLTANSPKVKEKPLGKGAFKIDPNRPINN
tara:strand:- start:2 stop:559 length:558 start_codon:yes stop_codon:yes gene_type:complete